MKFIYTVCFICFLTFSAQAQNLEDLTEKYMNGEIQLEELLVVLPQIQVNGRQLVGFESKLMYSLFLIKDKNIKLADFDIDIFKEKIAESYGKFTPKLKLSTDYSKNSNLSNIDPDSETQYLSYNNSNILKLGASISKLTQGGSTWSLSFEQLQTSPESLSFKDKDYSLNQNLPGTEYSSSSLALSGKIPFLKGGGDSSIYSVKISEVEYKSALIQKMLTMRTVFNQSISVFWSLASAFEGLKLQLDNVKNAETAMRDAIVKARTGDVSEIVKKQAESLYLLEKQKLDSNQLVLINFEQQIKDALDLKSSPIGLYPIFDEKIPDIDFSESAKQNTVALAIEHSLEYQLLLQQYSRLITNRKKFRNDNLSELNLDLTLRLQGQGEDFSNSTAGYSQTDIANYSVGLTYSIPLGDDGTASKLTSVNTEIIKKRREISNLKADIALNVETRLRNLEFLLFSHENARFTAEIRKELFEQERIKFRTGLSTLLDLDQARVNFFAAQIDITNIYADLIKQYEELLVVTGSHPLLKFKKIFEEDKVFKAGE